MSEESFGKYDNIRARLIGQAARRLNQTDDLRSRAQTLAKAH